MTIKQETLKSFQQIPGVGKSIANDLWNIGLRSHNDIKNSKPEDLYNKLCEQQKRKVGRCVLYVFRCAVYYVTEENHDPKLLKWWNWKDLN